MHVRRSLLILALCTVLPLGAPLAGQAPGTLASPDQVIKLVRDRLAPDHRLTVFDVAITGTAQTPVATGEVESVEAHDAVLQALKTAAGLPMVDHIVVLPDASLGATTRAIVRVSVANVKSKPSHQADMASQAVMGWTARVLKKQSGWYLVHTEPDNYLGWIEELQLTLVNENGITAWTTAPRVIVVSPITSVRERATSDSTPVTDVVIGSLLRSDGREGSWTRVMLPDGRRGYLRDGEAVELESWKAALQPTAANVELTALQFMGIPYLWGGTSSKGFDCSGFTKTVLRMNGIELPRDADQQAQTGMEVPIGNGLDQLQKGDLLFFGTRAAGDRPERITHVGIYVGAGEFLHASGLVRRNSLLPSSPIYSESHRGRLLRARRVLK